MKPRIEYVVKFDVWSQILIALVALGLLSNAAAQFRGVNAAMAQAPSAISVTGNLEISPPRNGSFRVQCLGCR